MLDLRQKKGGAVINNEDITVTANNTYTASEGYTGLGTVVVNVQPDLETLTATANGSYTPSENKDGFSAVTVNVPLGNPLEYTGLKTIYRATTSIGSSTTTSTLYPHIDNGRVLVNPTRSTDTTDLSNISGYVCDFNFPATITSFYLEMAFKYLGTSGYWENLTGLGISNYEKRYYIPFLQLNSSGYMNYAFSANGSSWALNYLESTKQILANDFVYLKFSLQLNDNNTVTAYSGIKLNDEADYTTVMQQDISASAICSPATINNYLSLYWGSASGGGKSFNAEADMTKTKIIINGTTYVDGSMK